MATSSSAEPSSTAIVAIVTSPRSIPTAMLQLHKEAIDFTSAPVVVRVGSPPVAYHVNNQLLCSSSEFFRAALGPRWAKGNTVVVDMPDDNADAFNVYFNWLHQGIVSLDFEERNTSDWPPVIMAYALADKLLAVDYKDAITDAVATMMATRRSPGVHSLPLSGSLDLAYEKLARDSKLNLMVAHMFARLSNSSELLAESAPAGFLYNVSQQLISKAKEAQLESTLAASTRCAFHEHAPGPENCYRSRRA